MVSGSEQLEVTQVALHGDAFSGGLRPSWGDGLTMWWRFAANQLRGVSSSDELISDWDRRGPIGHF